MMEDAIQMEQVVKLCKGGVRAINGVSLCVRRGERVEIRGAAGSGKTTLLRLIAGMDAPSAGSIFVFDKPVHTMSADDAAEFRKRAIGVLNRQPCLWDRLPVIDNVTLPLTLRGVSISQRETAGMELLRRFSIAHVAHARPHSLSEMEMQMAALARALIAKPPILLLDDWTANCTEKDAARMDQLLLEMAAADDTTIVYATSSNSGRLCATRRFTLDHGSIWEETP